MNDMPTQEERQAIVDDEHLKLLSIAYLIAGATNACFSLFGLFYMFMGLVFSTAMTKFPSQAGQPQPPEFMGWFFGLFGAAFFIAMATLATLKFLAAHRLKARRSRTLCMVAAGLTCFEIPYGTALGVWTLLVLSRPSVARLFEPRPEMTA
jgi:hypothetical protein